MSDGLEISEAPEAPKKEEVQESPEKVAEVKEAAEQAESTRAAVEEPKKVIEHGDYQAAESLEEAFVGAMDAVEAAPKTDAVAAAPLETSDLTGSVIVERSAPETETSPETGTVVTTETAAAEVKTGSGQPEIHEKVETKPETSEARSAESQILPEEMTVEREGGEPKLVITDQDADDGSFNPDEVYEQSGDKHEPNQVTDQFGELDERGGSVGYIGDPAGGAGEIPEVPDMIPDLGMDGPGVPNREIPDLGLPGLDQESEIEDLAASAAFGADGRISAGDWTGRTEMTDYSDSSGKQNISYNESYEDDDHSMTVNTTHSDGVTTQTVTSTNKKTGETTTETSTTGGDEGEAAPPSTEEESYDPEGDYQYTNIETDHTLGGRIKNPIPVSSPEDDLGAESLMQPVGEEDSASRKDPNLVFDRSSQTDPYAQYTGEETNIPGIVPAGEVDADGNLIDGPDTVLGEEGGFISTDSSKKNVADSEDAANLNAADLSSDGQVPKP